MFLILHRATEVFVLYGKSKGVHSVESKQAPGWSLFHQITPLYGQKRPLDLLRVQEVARSKCGTTAESNPHGQACGVLAGTGLVPHKKPRRKCRRCGWRPFVRTRGVKNPIRAKRFERAPPVGFPQTQP